MSAYDDKEYYGLTDRLGKGGLPPDQKYRILVETDDMGQMSIVDMMNKGFSLGDIMYKDDVLYRTRLVYGCEIMRSILGTWRKKHV